MSIRRAEREGATPDAAALNALRDRLLAVMPGPHARRAEVDAGALLEAQGFAARPGPVVRAEPGVLETVSEALKGPFLLAIAYARPDGEPTERTVAPHGVLLGMRRYLVARDEGRDATLRHFRVDRIRAARLLGSSFVREPDFDIDRHAARAFGSYQDEARYGEVVWRFLPRAAATARDFLFHPGQTTETEPDGSLVVRFNASGWLEMAWHLYQWGDAVEVLAPEGLRALVEGFRRPDFEALP